MAQQILRKAALIFVGTAMAISLKGQISNVPQKTRAFADTAKILPLAEKIDSSRKNCEVLEKKYFEVSAGRKTISIGSGDSTRVIALGSGIRAMGKLKQVLYAAVEGKECAYLVFEKGVLRVAKDAVTAQDVDIAGPTKKKIIGQPCITDDGCIVFITKTELGMIGKTAKLMNYSELNPGLTKVALPNCTVAGSDVYIIDEQNYIDKAGKVFITVQPEKDSVEIFIEE